MEIQTGSRKTNRPQNMKSSRYHLLILSAGSAVLYIVSSLFIIHWFHEDSAATLLSHGANPVYQVFTGLAAGSLAAASATFAIRNTPLPDILEDYAILRIMKELRLKLFDRIQISLFAGFGEEILFRAALQPIMGIWLTSLLFVGLHGYFRFNSLKHILFGGMMFFLSAGLGLLYEYSGLLAAMTAHAVYDFVMLQCNQSVFTSKNDSGMRL